MKGTIRRIDPRGHGIIDAEDGSKVPFLLIDVLSRRVLVAGQRVFFSVRRVQDKIFAENVSYAAERSPGART